MSVILFSVCPGIINSVYLVLPFILLSQIHQLPEIRAQRGFGTDVSLLVSATFLSQVPQYIIWRPGRPEMNQNGSNPPGRNPRSSCQHILWCLVASMLLRVIISHGLSKSRAKNLILVSPRPTSIEERKVRQMRGTALQSSQNLNHPFPGGS